LASNQLKGQFHTFKPLKNRNSQTDLKVKEPGKLKGTRWKKENIFNFATLNVRSIHNQDDQLDDNLNKKNIQIAVIPETKRKLHGTKGTKNYMQIYIVE
jgi:hypothetical protein